MATRKADRPLQRNFESARPVSFATVESYTTIRDTTHTGRELASLMRYEPGFEGVKVVIVRAAIAGRYPRGPRKPGNVD